MARRNELFNGVEANLAGGIGGSEFRSKAYQRLINKWPIESFHRVLRRECLEEMDKGCENFHTLTF